MSVEKIVNLGAVDMNLLKGVIQKLGYRYSESNTVNIYGRSPVRCDLVAHTGRKYDIGWRTENDQTTAYYDSDATSDFNKINGAYTEERVVNHLGQAFYVADRTESAEEITLVVRRS